MADCAVGNHAREALVQDRLEVVGRGRRGCDRMRASVAREARHSPVPEGFTEQFPRLLELKAGSAVTVGTARLINPRRPIGAAHITHLTMARDAIKPVGRMHIALALRTAAWMARVALVVEARGKIG